MRMNRHSIVGIALVAAILTSTGCKKAEPKGIEEEQVITLPPGLIHISAQWVEGQLWVESYDPITNACLLRQYDAKGKALPGTPRVRLKGCRLPSLPPAAPAEAAAPPAAPAATP